ncbi:MAG: SLC13 family permease [Ignavibacteriales bacterium]
MELVLYGKEISRKITFNPRVQEFKVNRPLLIKSLFVLLAVFGLFIYGVSYPFAALIGGALILLIGVVEPKFAFGEVNWTLLLFFAGLFVVMGGVEKSGLSEILFEKASPLFGLGSWKGMLGISGVILILSNLVSNVPAVMLFAPHINIFPNPQKGWLVLAMASTLAGNFTLIGSVANLIIAEIAKEGGRYNKLLGILQGRSAAYGYNNSDWSLLAALCLGFTIQWNYFPSCPTTRTDLITTGSTGTS